MSEMSIEVSGLDELRDDVDGMINAYCETVSYSVYNDAEYAPYVENGTYKMAAQPFMRPGLEHAARNFGSIARQNERSIDAICSALADDVYDIAYARCAVDTGYLRSRIQKEGGSGGGGV